MQALRVDYTDRPTLKDPDKAAANASLQSLLNREKEPVGELILRDSSVTGSALFGNQCLSVPGVVALRKSLRVLDLSGTQCSSTLFCHLSDFPKLQQLFVERCSEMKLVRVDGHKKIQAISLLGTVAMPEAIKSILTNCPKLKQLDCTIDLSDVVPIGFKNRHALIRPKVQFPGGTIVADNVLGPQGASFEYFGSLDVRIQKIEGVWSVFLLDAHREPITDKSTVYIHTGCNRFVASKDCSCNIPGKLFHVTLPLDSSLDLAKDFDLLPPKCWYDHIRRSEAYHPQKK